MNHGENEESIALLMYLMRKEKILKKGEDPEKDRLSVLFGSYRKKITEKKENGLEEAVTTLKTALMTAPSNKRFMRYCLDRGLFYNLSMMVRCFTGYDETTLNEEFMGNFLKKAKRSGREIIFETLCQISSMLSMASRKAIEKKIYEDPGRCSVRCLYYVLSDFLVKMTPGLREHITKLIEQTGSKKASEGSLENPVYMVVKLYKEGCINSVSGFFKGDGTRLYRDFAYDPASFGKSMLDAFWWKLLTPEEYRKILSSPEGEELFDKVMSENDRSFCSVKALMCSLNRDLGSRRIRDREVTALEKM